MASSAISHHSSMSLPPHQPPSSTNALATTAAGGNINNASTNNRDNSSSPNDATPGPTRASPTPRREVDYYLNPTELFRWINYRRWDGAKARVLSHPDECATWIVSRHSSDGRVLWRHLPLHLVCMQSGAQGGGTNDGQSTVATPSGEKTSQQVEELIDVLLEAYPEGASSPDDQGMLPLHLAVANGNTPNERILNLLLMSNPSAVDAQDTYGRTPVDILQEQSEGGERKDAALRAMVRAQHTTARMVAAVRDENADVVSSVKQSANNERFASQRIIMRLEEELADTRRQMENMENRNKDERTATQNLERRLETLQAKLDASTLNVENLRKEREELFGQNEVLRQQASEHENVVSNLRRNADNDRQDQADVIAKLRSEVSTAKAMSEALESQLRSRFTNEEYLTSTVSELEKQLTDEKMEYQRETKKLMHERDTYENENTQLKRSVDELTKKNTSAQSKLTDLNKQMGNILSSHGALNAEHDRAVESGARFEEEIVEAIRTERSKTSASLAKQRELIEAAMAEQERIAEEAKRREAELLEIAREERERGVELVGKLRQDFREARASAVQRGRELQAEKLSSSITKSNLITQSKKSSSSRSQKSNKGGGKSNHDRSSSSINQQRAIPPPPTTRGGSDSPTTPRNSNKKYNSSSPMQSSYHSSPAPSSRTGDDSGPSTHQQNSLQVESRAPPNSMSHQQHGSSSARQGPVSSSSGPGPSNEGHLLTLLENRAEQGGGAGAPHPSYGRPDQHGPPPPPTYRVAPSSASAALNATGGGNPSGMRHPRYVQPEQREQHQIPIHRNASSGSGGGPRGGGAARPTHQHPQQQQQQQFLISQDGQRTVSFGDTGRTRTWDTQSAATTTVSSPGSQPDMSSDNKRGSGTPDKYVPDKERMRQGLSRSGPPPMPVPQPTLSLDEYTQNSESSGSASGTVTESEASIRRGGGGGGDGNYRGGTSGGDHRRQFPGMSAGLKMGMIRIGGDTGTGEKESLLSLSRRNGREELLHGKGKGRPMESESIGESSTTSTTY